MPRLEIKKKKGRQKIMSFFHVSFETKQATKQQGKSSFS